MKNLRYIIQDKNGFSLVELIVVIAVSSIIAGILARFVLFGTDTYTFVDKRKELLRDARLAVHFMNRDFRQVRKTNGVIIASENQFKYFDYNNQQYNYQYLENRLERNGNTLADDITSFEFKYQRSDGNYMNVPVTSDSLKFIWNIEAEFTITKDENTQDLVVVVHPRNY